ncbi:unnamed protein product, partial [Sphacelaria rigidula]
RKSTVTNHSEVDSAWGAWHEQHRAALQHSNGVKEDQLLVRHPPEEAPTPSPYNARRGHPRGSPGGCFAPSGHHNKRLGSLCTSQPTPAGASASKSKRKKKKTTETATPGVDPGRVKGASSSSLAGSEQEQVAPAPTHGAVGEVMRHPDRQAPPPDTDRGEHRARSERGRMSTRRSSFQGPPGNRDGYRREHSAPAGSNLVTGIREPRGRKRVCSRDVCDMQFAVVDNACNTCSSFERTHDPVSRLCFACHRPGPGEGNVWRHLGAARFPE